jgi:hypothetical protein
MINKDLIHRFLNKYQDAHISAIPFEEIKSDIHEVIVSIPFPTVALDDRELIERIRNNYDGEIFESWTQLSARKDINNIQTYGRLNVPYSSVFYGTLEGANLDMARITTIMETHKIFRNDIIDATLQQIFTTSQWKVNGNLTLLIIPFHNASDMSQRIKTTAVKFLDRFVRDFPQDYPSFIKLLNFFSQQLAKPVLDHEQYKFTAALSEVFLKDYHLDGIIYPSIKTGYQTENIAVKAESVNKLELFKVAMFELFIHKKQTFIDPIAYATDLGVKKENFNWVQVKERTPIHIIQEKIGLADEIGPSHP